MGFADDRMRSQAAVEYLITYGWAILIVTIAVGLIYYYILLPRTVTTNGCAVSEGAVCESVVLGSASNGITKVAVFFTNLQTYPIFDPSLNVSFNGGNSTSSCSPSYATAGGSVICVVTLNGLSTSIGQFLSGNMYFEEFYCGVTNNPYNQSLCASTAPKEVYSGDYYGHTSNAISPTFNVIMIYPSAFTPMPGNSYTIQARVLMLGYPLKGATVNFTTGNTAIMRLVPQYIDTNSNGVATTTAYSYVYNSVSVCGGFAGVQACNTISP